MDSQSNAGKWRAGWSLGKVPSGKGCPHSHGDNPHWHGAGLAFSHSGFGSDVGWYSAVPHSLSTLTAATSKFSCFLLVNVAWGTSQSGFPQPLVKLSTPSRDRRGGNQK